MPYKNVEDHRRANKAAYERRREQNSRTCARCGVVHIGRYTLCKDCRAVLNTTEQKAWETVA